MERLLWRGTILLLRLFGDFPPVFLFGSKISAHSTKPAPPFLNLSVRTAQPCSSPAPRRASSHPLQNRVPRSAGHLWRSAAPVSAPRLGRCWALPTGEQHPSRQPKPKSFCHFQKSQVSLLRYLTFSLVCGRIWQRGAPAGPPAVRVVGACSPVGCVQARPRRQPRQVRPLIFS